MVKIQWIRTSRIICEHTDMGKRDTDLDIELDDGEGGVMGGDL